MENMFLILVQLNNLPGYYWDKYIDILDWPCGPTDKASDYESGDCRFESCQGQSFFVVEMSMSI